MARKRKLDALMQTLLTRMAEDALKRLEDGKIQTKDLVAIVNCAKSWGERPIPAPRAGGRDRVCDRGDPMDEGSKRCLAKLVAAWL